MDPVRIALPEAMDFDLVFRLRERLVAAEVSESATAIVLEGGDGTFCNGLGFASIESLDSEQPAVARALRTFADCLRILHAGGKPTIAVVDGSASGGGVGLAAACDVVIASDTSRFSLPEVLFGLLPAIVWPILLDRMSVQKCRLWALTGESRGAHDAKADGLVDDVVSRDQLHGSCRRWTRRLSRGGAGQIARFKSFASQPVEGQDEALERGILLTSQAVRDANVVTRLQAFGEEGVPPWKHE